MNKVYVNLALLPDFVNFEKSGNGVIHHLNGTRTERLTLSDDSLHVIKWYMEARGKVPCFSEQHSWIIEEWRTSPHRADEKG